MANCDVSINVIKKVTERTIGSGNSDSRSDRTAVGRLSALVSFSNTKAVVGRRLGFRCLRLCDKLLGWKLVLSEKPTSTVGCWVSILTSNVVIWLVRLSTLFSVARIIYPSLTLRGMVLGIALMFFVVFISFMTAKLWYYCRDLSWTNNSLFFGNALLPLSTNLVIFELTIDFIADAVLIVLPIKLLWSVKLPTRQRRMILLVFASGIMVTIAAVCRAICQLLDLDLIVPLVMDVEVALSSIMCNLLVFVTFLYLYGRSASPPLSTKTDEDDDYTTPFRPRQTS
ncbi:hypothetical protein EDD15DRAFT_2366104 [Pisolithus albus]|nr:hypothetical protein EDD15DRAFT_2366104 [Pisolithus albus]